MRSALLEHWRRAYGDTAMAGWALRERYARRWVRLWSLPDAQRYAQTEAEHAEILHRQNTAITGLLSAGGPVWLLVCVDEPWPPEVTEAVGTLGLKRVTSPEDGWSAILGAALTWQPGCIDPLLRAVADDALRVLVVSAQPPRVAAPYDGGLDLILESEAARDELAWRHRAWRSTHPLGL